MSEKLIRRKASILVRKGGASLAETPIVSIWAPDCWPAPAGAATSRAPTYPKQPSRVTRQLSSPWPVGPRVRIRFPPAASQQRTVARAACLSHVWRVVGIRAQPNRTNSRILITAAWSHRPSCRPRGCRTSTPAARQSRTVVRAPRQADRSTRAVWTYLTNAFAGDADATVRVRCPSDRAGALSRPGNLPVRQKGGHNAGDLGEGPSEAGGARALPEGDRGGCPRLRAGRAGLYALQRPSGRPGPERLLLLRGLPGRSGSGDASGGSAFRRLAGGRGHARWRAPGDTMPDRISRGGGVLGAKIASPG